MNGTDIIQQLRLLCYMIAFGLAIMFGFALTNEVKKQAKWNRYKCMVSDFVLIVLYGMIFCVLLICKNYGLLRNYILLGLVIGFALYRIFLRSICQKICRHIAKLIVWCCKKIKRVLLAPWHLGKRHFVQPVTQKILAVYQRRARTAQTDDELEEII